MPGHPEWLQSLHDLQYPARAVAEHDINGVDHADGVYGRARSQQVCRTLVWTLPEEESPASLDARFADVYMHGQSAAIVFDAMRDHVRNASMRW